MTFAALMRQECGWFDDENHSTGVLSARLTGDAANIQSVCSFILMSNYGYIFGHILTTQFSQLIY